MSEHTRIKFYSVHDLSFASNMKRVESFFEKWEQNTCSPDINTILELYNIKQYFSTGRVLSTWSNEQLDEYQKKVSLIPGIIGRFCNSVLDEEWNCMFKSTEINYVDDFWTVIDNYKVYSKISANTIGSILDSNSDCVWYILRHRALSAYYGTVLTNHLLTNCNTAPRMISFFLETSSEQDDHLYFPEEFTPEMRIKIINDYVDEENPNINTLQLLENARVFDGQPIEDKLRRKVRNKRKELQEKLSDKAVGISYGIQVEFNSVPNGAYEEKFNRADNTIHCTYSPVRVEVLGSAFGTKRLPVGYCRTALCADSVFVCVDIDAAARTKALTVIKRLAAFGTCCWRIFILFHSLFTFHILARCFALLLHNNCADYEENAESCAET